MDNSVIYDVSFVQGTGQTFQSHGYTFSFMTFKTICKQDSQLERWFYDYHDKPRDHVGTARLFAINGETGEIVRTYNLQNVYPADCKRFEGYESEYLTIDFNGLFQHDMVTESV